MAPVMSNATNPWLVLLGYNCIAAKHQCKASSASPGVVVCSPINRPTSLNRSSPVRGFSAQNFTSTVGKYSKRGRCFVITLAASTVGEGIQYSPVEGWAFLSPPIATPSLQNFTSFHVQPSEGEKSRRRELFLLTGSYLPQTQSVSSSVC